MTPHDLRSRVGARTTEDLVSAVREAAGDELADEVESWRCPTRCLGERRDPCGSRVISIEETVSAMAVVPVDEDAAKVVAALHHDPGPPYTTVRAVAVDLTFRCENGHDVYVRTRGVPARGEGE